jgi:hypothetical protein
MDTQFIRISDLPLPAPVRQDHAFQYHVNRYQRWLSTAGASPRVAVALCPEVEQLQDLINALEAKDVEIEPVEITESRPIPEPILRHQGDHFNRRLFVISGLRDDAISDELLGRLDGYVDHYAKVATWVLFVIQDTTMLNRFAQLAPQLWSRVGRCVPVSGPVTVLSDACVTPQRSRTPRLEYACTVLSGLSGVFASEYRTWSRLCRVGYAHCLIADESSPASTVQSLWHQADAFGPAEPATEPGEQLPAWFGEAYARHGHRGVYPWVSPETRRTEDRYLVKQLSKFHGLFAQNTSPSDAEVESFRENYALQTSPDLQIEAGFVDAQLYAENEDLEGMLDAFNRSVLLVEKASLEAGFEALYRLAEVFVLLEMHTDARRSLTRLGEFETQLMSPLYEARYLLLKGRFILGLDPLKGAEVLGDAYRLFAAHGYPGYTAQVQELTSTTP